MDYLIHLASLILNYKRLEKENSKNFKRIEATFKKTSFTILCSSQSIN